MRDYSFMSDLTSMIRDDSGEFRAKSNDWHSRLAGILIGLSERYSSELRKLELVPLEDGSWVSASGRQILFPANKKEFELPGGLELMVVDSNAAADPARRNLYNFLGVGDLRQEPIVQHIQDLHMKHGGSFKVVSREQLLSQVKFLYSADWENPAFQRFWFMSESGQRLHGSQLYQDSSKPHSATRYFRKNRTKFPFIHEDYMVGPADNNRLWTKWLEEKMDIASIPRLVQTTPDRGFRLSEDFEYIIKTFPS
jgi:hypothetical protein